MTRRRTLLALLAGTAVLGACRAHAPPITVPGQHAQTFQARVERDVQARYLVYVPEGYDPARPGGWPLLLFLHGAGERGTDLARVKIHGPPKILDARRDFPFVVVSPQAEGDSIWSNLALDALLDDVIARYGIDPDRVYGTGLSMGGYGLWQLAMEFPHRFAAIAPVSAGAVPSGACALRHLPIWAFHGRRDEIVPLDRATQLVDRIRACEGGGDIRLTVYDDAGHDAWTRTYENPELYAWLLRQRRGAPSRASGDGARAPAAPATAPTLDAVIAAEDRRARTEADLAVLRAGIASPDAAVRAHAVRALGRLEQPGVLPLVLSRLDDADAAVRERAAWSAAQAVAQPARDSTGAHAEMARAALVARLEPESSAAARDELLESIGRIRADSAAAARAASLLAGHLPARGAVRGLYFLSRQRTARPAFGALPPTVAAGLMRVVADVRQAEDVRMTAAAARLALGGATAADSAAIRRDPAGSVRALAATAAMLDDPAPIVRHRAVALAGCDALARAVADTNVHVALAAVDRMARCTDAASVAALDAVPHPRATVALASAAPARARARLPALVRSADPFARVHAARAARALGETAALRRLAVDRDPNVASEAVDGLYATAGTRDPADVALYVRALDSDASQLLMSAARALDSVPSAEPALLRALDRVTALRRETSRDARLALVDALGAAVPARLARDFDPAVAARAATLAGVRAEPQPLPDAPLPTVSELRSVRGATIEMASGDTIELELFPMDAPTNVGRFVRLARAGWFDGLTFHRVAPFFVVQGGSPLANEYAGDAAFSRDELGRENLRGTVGLSTRGRDTGDGQLYVNTVDNVRLDHDYTVWGRVVRGMDAVDRMQEGATIRRVTVH